MKTKTTKFLLPSILFAVLQHCNPSVPNISPIGLLGDLFQTGNVTAVSTPPSTLAYAGNPFTFAVGTAIPSITPTVTGTVTSYSVSPALPTGLTMDSTSGALSGTPTTSQSATDYTITALNSAGSTTAKISITISALVVATPTFTPAAGNYNTAQNIAISTTTAGASIYYTTDGTAPTPSSTAYNTAMHIWTLAGKTIKAYATKTGFMDSTVLSGVFSYLPLKSGAGTISGYTLVAGEDGLTQSGTTRSYTGPTADSRFASIIANSDYTTTDNATGLVWKTCSQGQSGATCATGSAVTLTWDNATNDVINGCNALNTANGGNGYAGVKIWRLPTRQELETLADYGKATTAINTIAFPATVTSSSYWSSTASATATTTMWGLEFTYGTNSNITKTSGYYVRCVYGQSKDTTLNFTDNANGTVTDNTTGLIWQKCSMGQNNDGTCSGTATTATWAGALTYCNTTLNNLPSSSPRTWRLPNINELKTILDITKATGATTNTTIFPATVVASVYWSSTTLFSVTSDAWNASFNDSSVTLLPSKNSSYYVRCVSGP